MIYLLTVLAVYLIGFFGFFLFVLFLNHGDDHKFNKGPNIVRFWFGLAAGLIWPLLVFNQIRMWLKIGPFKNL